MYTYALVQQTHTGKDGGLRPHPDQQGQWNITNVMCTVMMSSQRVRSSCNTTRRELPPQEELCLMLLLTSYLLGLLLNPEDGGSMFLWTLTSLHSVRSLKTVLYSHCSENPQIHHSLSVLLNVCYHHTSTLGLSPFMQLLSHQNSACFHDLLKYPLSNHDMLLNPKLPRLFGRDFNILCNAFPRATCIHFSSAIQSCTSVSDFNPQTVS
jgi:hypothetical protein